MRADRPLAFWERARVRAGREISNPKHQIPNKSKIANPDGRRIGGRNLEAYISVNHLSVILLVLDFWLLNRARVRADGPLAFRERVRVRAAWEIPNPKGRNIGGRNLEAHFSVNHLSVILLVLDFGLLNLEFVWNLEFEFWNLFGTWDLRFEIWNFPLRWPSADRAVSVWQPGLLGKEATAEPAPVLLAVRAGLALAYSKLVRLLVEAFEAGGREPGHRARQRRRHAKHGRRRNADVR